MKAVRWKNRYLSGNADTDHQNRALVECLNGLINATKQREHCQEIEKLLEDTTAQLEKTLSENPGVENLLGQTKSSLLKSLPLPSHGQSACRKCDICDLAQNRIAQHIQSSAQCLGIKENPSSSANTEDGL